MGSSVKGGGDRNRTHHLSHFKLTSLLCTTVKYDHNERSSHHMLHAVQSQSMSDMSLMSLVCAIYIYTAYISTDINRMLPRHMYCLLLTCCAYC